MGDKSAQGGAGGRGGEAGWRVGRPGAALGLWLRDMYGRLYGLSFLFSSFRPSFVLAGRYEVNGRVSPTGTDSIVYS